MFSGFERQVVDTGEARIVSVTAGSGPPVLLLHGHPQTHAMWHLVAPRLAADFTVVATDLRGYGDSSAPDSLPDHRPYSKRSMARDQVVVMERLGFRSFHVAGHDRGARCAYRMALDSPERVRSLAVLDIVPTATALGRIDLDFAVRMWRWWFLAQPEPVPERLIAGDPEEFYFAANRHLFAPEALAEYRRCTARATTVHAMCEDYRAGVTVDLQDDLADLGRRRIGAPLLALWGGRSTSTRSFDVLAAWREWADDVRGEALDCGHHLPEERPEETYDRLFTFFTEQERPLEPPLPRAVDADVPLP